VKKIDQQGISVVEGLLLVVTVAIIGFVGWYVYKAQNAGESRSVSDSQKAAPEEYKRTTTTPKDWVVYSNQKYKFSFSHPADWKLDENTVKAGESDDFSKNATEVYRVCVKASGAVQWCPYLFNVVVGQPLADTVSQYMKASNELQKKTLLVDGHDAVEITQPSAKLKSGKSSPVTHTYLISVNGSTYVFGSVADSDDPLSPEIKAEESLQLFESLKFE
jgi:hypothetical protein